MMISSLNFIVFAADDLKPNAEAVSDRYIELFGSLGVFSKTYNKTDGITRAQYAKMLTNLLSCDDILSSMRGITYSDVAVDAPLSKEINLMNAMGIMTAKEGDKFCPGDLLTMDEAVVCVVRVLGYTIAAEESGGVPAGYNKIADSLGLRRGIQSTLMTPYASAGAVARLFYNALDIEILSYDGSMTIFRDYLKLERGTGQVSAVYGLSMLSGTKLQSGEIMIGNKTFTTSLPGMVSYLGCDVEYYCREDKDSGKYKMLYARPLQKPNEIKISSDDIDSFKKGIITYEEEGKSKPSELRIDDGAVVIYNGNPVANFDESYRPKNGYVQCISAEGGRLCNVVIIFDYQSFVIDSVFDGTVKFKYGNKFTDRDGSEYTTITFTADNSIIEREGNYIQPDSLAKNEVISVAYSGKTYYVKVSRETVKGVVREIASDPIRCYINGEYYSINDKFAFLAENGVPNTKRFDVGLNAVFYLDWTKKIVGMDAASSEMRYGYLKAVDDKKHIVKMYDIYEKEFLKFNLSKNCKYNGSRRRMEEVSAELVKYKEECRARTIYDSNENITELVPPIVKFKVNEDFTISSIVTRTYNLAPVGSSPSENQVSRDTPVSDDYIIMSAPYGLKVWDYSYNIFTSYASDVGNIRTKGFPGMQLPTSESEEDFDGAGNVESLMPQTDNKSYNVIIYDIDFETGTPGFVVYVVESGGTNVDVKTELYGVGGVTEAVDEKGDYCMSLKLYPASTAIETVMYTNDGSKVLEACKKLKKGDVIQVRTNYRNRITGISKVISYDRPEDFNKAEYTSPGGEQYKRCADGVIMFFSRYVSSRYITNGNIGTVARFAVTDQTSGTPFLQTLEGKCLIYDGCKFYRGDSDNIAMDDWVFGIGFIEKCSRYVVFKYDTTKYTEYDEFARGK